MSSKNRHETIWSKLVNANWSLLDCRTVLTFMVTDMSSMGIAFMFLCSSRPWTWRQYVSFSTSDKYLTRYGRNEQRNACGSSCEITTFVFNTKFHGNSLRGINFLILTHMRHFNHNNSLYFRMWFWWNSICSSKCDLLSFFWLPGHWWTNSYATLFCGQSGACPWHHKVSAWWTTYFAACSLPWFGLVWFICSSVQSQM